MNNTAKTHYSASFTAGGLLFHEFDALIDILQQENRDKLLKDEINKNEYLKLNSEHSRIRIITEIKKRIKYIDSEYYKFYISCNEQEKKLLLFYLMLKVYPLVFEFHFNVTVELWKKGMSSIDQYYYQMKLDEISATDTEVDSWSDSTKLKVITRYNLMLVQAGVIKDGTMVPPLVQDQFWCFFIRKNDNWFLDACMLSNEKKSTLKHICL